MHTSSLEQFLANTRPALAMCVAGIVILVVGLWAAKKDIARASGLDKIVALSNLSFAVPLAVFGALHVAGPEFVASIVPPYMMWPMFWAYFVGVALLAASLSIATKIEVRWSGLLLGIMLLLFVVMLDIPAVLATPGERINWTLTIRELSFAAGGWIFAGDALRAKGGRKLIIVGRVLIAIAALFFGVEHFLHPLGRPGVPLEKLTPEWIPGRLLIGYLTGAILVAAGVCLLVAKKTRLAATCLGTWILLLVVFVYGPILIAALLDPSIGAKVEGINYFADTLFFGGAILALASASPRTD